jgi:hypothetical protein
VFVCKVVFLFDLRNVFSRRAGRIAGGVKRAADEVVLINTLCAGEGELYANRRWGIFVLESWVSDS